MDEALHIRDDIVIPAGELRFTASRSGGPGGQHVNTTSSRVILQWNVDTSACLSEGQRARIKEKLRNRISLEGFLQVAVDTERSQYQNQQTARERLAALVRTALLVPKKRIPTKTTKGATKRRLEQKHRIARIKQARMNPHGDE